MPPSSLKSGADLRAFEGQEDDGNHDEDWDREAKPEQQRT
jgi:hypothetical protein